MSLYDVLEVKETASQDEIRKSYYKLMLKYHPDKFSSSNGESYCEEKINDQKSKEIIEAYRILGTAPLRKEYDSSNIGT